LRGLKALASFITGAFLCFACLQQWKEVLKVLKFKRLKVGVACGSKNKVPRIYLQGTWLEQLGFTIGRRIIVEQYHERLHIRIDRETEKDISNEVI